LQSWDGSRVEADGQMARTERGATRLVGCNERTTPPTARLARAHGVASILALAFVARLAEIAADIGAALAPWPMPKSTATRPTPVFQQSPYGRVCKRTSIVACVIVPVLILAVCTGSAETAGKGGKRGKGKRKGALPTASASPGEGEQSLTNIPLPIGHEAKGLTLPDFDKDGRLRGKFIAGAAKRLDQDHVAFSDLKITTYTEENKVDLQIAMRTSTFDLTTKILSSQERTTVSRADFNVVGDSAIFDTNARTSRMIGNVKMVITDQSSLMKKEEQPSPQPSPQS
jgi:hypothetical protein